MGTFAQHQVPLQVSLVAQSTLTVDLDAKADAEADARADGAAAGADAGGIDSRSCKPTNPCGSASISLVWTST